MRYPQLTLGLMVTFAFSICLPAAAQEKKVQLAATHLHQVDHDFFLQGEYMGYLNDDMPNSPWRIVGLQVIARGAGAFDGVMYTGGLPGSGWNRFEKTDLKGVQKGGTLDLWGGPWRVIVESGYALVHHSLGAPLGQITKVNRVSPTMGATAPFGSKILFDGRDTLEFDEGRMTPDRVLKEGTQVKQLFEDFTMHVEFLLPYMPYEREQGRANSGIYIQSRYEVQILDSFGLAGVANECGGLYKFRAPDINMCLPPMTWQTYDIEFRSARFDDNGNKTRNAQISVWQNGVAVQYLVDLPNKTGAGAKEGPELLPTKIQDHSDPVRFRNIWIVDHRQPYLPKDGHPSPPVADPGIQYGTYSPPLNHYRAYEVLGPAKKARWFYYGDY